MENGQIYFQYEGFVFIKRLPEGKYLVVEDFPNCSHKIEVTVILANINWKPCSEVEFLTHLENVKHIIKQACGGE